MRSLLFIILLALLGCKAGREARELAKQRRAEAAPMSGMLSFQADAAALIECGTNERFVVKFKGDWLEVERAYVSFARPGAPLFISFRGRLEHDTTDGAIRAGLVIEEVLEMRPDTICNAAQALKP